MNIFNELVIIPRVQWEAKNPNPEEEITTYPVPFIVIYHDHKNRCKNQNECTQLVRKLQKEHMAQGKSDISYHYIVTVDGTVYEGRSLKSVGKRFPISDAEFKDVNNKSITFACLDNGDEALSMPMLKALLALTEKLRRDGLVDYDVVSKIYYPKGHPNKKKTETNKEEELFALMRKMGGSSNEYLSGQNSKNKKDKRKN